MNQSDICPRFETAVELLSKRWVALIVFQLLSSPQRFGEIEAALTNL
ncbi:winged helix-turn-helix transcriptional regulator, partial [Bacillus pumilus]